MRITNYLLFIPLMLLCMACSNDDGDYSVTISEYEIPEFCHPDIDKDKVVIINNKAEFNRAFANNKRLKHVDFKHSCLMLVSGVSTSGIDKIDKELTHTGNEYELKITITNNMLAVMEPWCVAYIVPKGFDKNKVKFTVK